MALALLVGVNPRVMKRGAVTRLAAGKWKVFIVGAEKVTFNKHFPEPQESFTIKDGQIIDCKVPTNVSIGLDLCKVGEDNISAYAAPE